MAPIVFSSTQASEPVTVEEPAQRPIDTLLQKHLETISEEIFKTIQMNPDCSSPTATLTHSLGRYLVKAAEALSELTHDLLQGPTINEEVIRQHERSRDENRLSDFLPLAIMDVEIERLRDIQKLTATFCDEVRTAWYPEYPDRN